MVIGPARTNGASRPFRVDSRFLHLAIKVLGGLAQKGFQNVQKSVQLPCALLDAGGATANHHPQITRNPTRAHACMCVCLLRVAICIPCCRITDKARLHAIARSRAGRRCNSERSEDVPPCLRQLTVNNLTVNNKDSSGSTELAWPSSFKPYTPTDIPVGLLPT